jgi:hypothetical protein
MRCGWLRRAAQTPVRVAILGRCDEEPQIGKTGFDVPTMRSVWIMYAEITYVTVLKVYAYQDSQPFVVGGYPIFLAFTTAMSALVGG